MLYTASLYLLLAAKVSTWTCNLPDYTLSELLLSHADDYAIFEGRILEKGIYEESTLESRVAILRSYNDGPLWDTVYVRTGTTEYGPGTTTEVGEEWLFFAHNLDGLNFWALSCDKFSVPLSGDKYRNYDGRGQPAVKIVRDWYEKTNSKYSGPVNWQQEEGRPLGVGRMVNGQAEGEWTHLSFGDRSDANYRRVNYLNGLLNGITLVYYYDWYRKDTTFYKRQDYDAGRLTYEESADGSVKSWYTYPRSHRHKRTVRLSSSGDTLYDMSHVTLDYENKDWRKIAYKTGYYLYLDTAQVSKGTPLARGYYQRDKKVGTWGFFDRKLRLDSIVNYEIPTEPNWRKVDIERYSSHLSGQYDDLGSRSGQWTQSYDGRKSRTELYDQDGKLAYEFDYYKDDRPHKTTPYVDGLKDGLEIEYYDNGLVESLTTWHNGIREGYQATYGKTGDLKSEYTYRHNRRNSLQLYERKMFYLNGYRYGNFKGKGLFGIPQEGEFYRGYKVGIWTENRLKRKGKKVVYRYPTLAELSVYNNFKLGQSIGTTVYDSDGKITHKFGFGPEDELPEPDNH